MAFAFVQSKASGSLVASINTVFDSTPVAGNLLVASVHDTTSAADPTVSDSNGAWTMLNVRDQGANGHYVFAKVAVASQPTSINAVRGADLIGMNLYEFSGQLAGAVGNVDDQIAQISGSAATTTAGSAPSITTTADGELVFAQLGTAGATSAHSFSDGSFTAGHATPVGAIEMVDYYRMNAPIGTYNGSFSWTSSSVWMQLITSMFAEPVVTATAGLFPVF